MKKIKIALISLFVCALGYGGYSAYDYVTMTEAERFLLANIEALAIDEPGGGGDGTIYKTCYKTFSIWADSDFPKGSTTHYACVPSRHCELFLPMVNGSFRDAGQCIKQY